jgi:transposase-like protein
LPISASPEVIMVVVRWSLRYGLSYRDVEELLADRNIEVDHVTVYRWVQRFTPLLIDAARPCRHAPSDRWFIDETYVKVAGRFRYLYRAIDQYGQVIDVLMGTVALTDDVLGQAELMRRRRRRVPPPQSGFAGFRFPREVIMLAVRWYLRYGLSYRDVEELLAERGITVDRVKSHSCTTM